MKQTRSIARGANFGRAGHSAAANAAGLPSVLITNFSFDSVYSYLSTPFVDRSESYDALQISPLERPLLPPDVPIPLQELEPLVEQLREGYRCADLLLRLPGCIPIPSFARYPDLPAQDWVDRKTRHFTRDVEAHLEQSASAYKWWPQIPFPPGHAPKTIPRQVIPTPLLVRSPDPAVYTPEGRSRLLSSLDVPVHLHNPTTTKILIVSFGGQVFHKPHSHSRTPSATGSPVPGHAVLTPSRAVNGVHEHKRNSTDTHHKLPSDGKDVHAAEALSDALRSNIVASFSSGSPRVVQRPPGTSKLIIPGAPPASIPNSPLVTSSPLFNTIPPTPRIEEVDGFLSASATVENAASAADLISGLLPDSSWIAIVCGVSQDWGKEDGEEMPESFFVAPKYVYMPDLTAVSDVLLGKLVCVSTRLDSGSIYLIVHPQGYGTVSECVDACTPFVYGQCSPLSHPLHQSPLAPLAD